MGDVGDEIVSGEVVFYFLLLCEFYVFPSGVEIMKKYTKQISEQDEGVKAEHQIMRRQSNPDATAATSSASKKQKDKEAEEEVCF